MSPDSPEGRLGRLEQGVARLEQRVDDLATDVRVMAPLIVQMAEQKLAMQHLQTEVHECSTSVETLRKDLAEAQALREQQRAAERRESLRNRWTLLTGVLFVVLTTVGGLIVQLTTAGP
jgi:uncharacterized protein YaaN involved in tellurite resistance